MRFHHRFKHLLTAGFAVLFLAQCGGESDAMLVKFETLPKKPIVITAPKITADGEQLAGPWFDFRIEASNDSDKVVTIIAIEMKVSIVDEYGAEHTAETTYSPGDANHSITVMDTDYTCSYDYFAVLQPGDSMILTAESSVPLNAACSSPDSFVAYGLPKTGSYRYRVRMKPIGWFGTYDKPTDRFERSFTFTTQ